MRTDGVGTTRYAGAFDVTRPLDPGVASLVQSVIDMSDPANSYSGQAWFGVGPPLVIGIGIAVIGVVVMLVWRSRDARFWQEKAGVVDPAQLPHDVTLRDDAGQLGAVVAHHQSADVVFGEAVEQLADGGA